jgi:hypothetical protein
LATHGLLDEPHDDHQDATADAARGNLADDRSYIETTSACRRLSAAPNKLTDDLRSDTAAYYPGDGVAGDAEVKLLEPTRRLPVRTRFSWTALGPAIGRLVCARRSLLASISISKSPPHPR